MGSDEAFPRFLDARCGEYRRDYLVRLASAVLTSLGQQLAIAAALQLAFELGGARRVFVSDQIDGWHDWNDPGPWQPGCGDSAFAVDAGRSGP